MMPIETVHDSGDALEIEETTMQNDLKEEQASVSKKKGGKENKTPEKHRYARLPLARVKHIMKTDPDCNIISQDAVFLTTKATEIFIETLGRETAEYTSQAKRKTVMKRDLEKAVKVASNLCFLDGMLDD